MYLFSFYLFLFFFENTVPKMYLNLLNKNYFKQKLNVYFRSKSGDFWKAYFGYTLLSNLIVILIFPGKCHLKISGHHTNALLFCRGCSIIYLTFLHLCGEVEHCKNVKYW